MSSHSEQFISSSDFATLKNYKNGSASVVIPASASIGGSSYVEYHQDLTIGIGSSLTRSRIRSSRFGSKWLANKMAIFDTRQGTNSGSPAFYSVYAFIWTPSSTTVRCQVYIPNPYSTTTLTSSTAETIDFYVNTFLPPFV